MEKSSKKSREDRGEYGKDNHRHHAGDGKRSSRDEKRHDSDLHSRDHYRDSKHYRQDREGSRDREAKGEKFYDSRDLDREKSRDLRDDRERVREYSRGREASVEERKHKRKDRERGEEVIDVEEKRPRVYEDDKKGRRRFEDESTDQNVERREKRKFGDKAKEEDSNGKDEVSDDCGAGVENGSVVAGNGAILASSIETPKVAPAAISTSSHPFSSKVSLITTANENTGVSIRSHEVPGKTSTDGTSSVAGKSGSLSLDALAKAKKALQMQKELSAKMKKIPLLNKIANTTSSGAAQVVQKDSTSFRTVSTDLPSAPVNTSGPSLLPVQGGIATVPDLSSIPNYEAVKRAQELAAKMGFRQDPQFAPLINLFPGQSTEIAMPQKPTKAPVLRLDALGREIDEHGNVVNLIKPSNLSTLKVNINKQKKDAFQILKPELEIDPESNPHFDARMGIDKVKLLRPKRMAFQFVEEGKWSKDAEMTKLKSHFGEARAKEQRAKQAQLAKAKAAPDINPNLIEVSERVIIREKPKDRIPEVEWWDVPILSSGTYDEVGEGCVVAEDKLKMEKLTIYVEHPRPIEPPAEAAPPPPQPLKLTKKEQKKLRTQRRLAREKERQEMIRQGLIEAPKAKVKMSNLMRVLGAEATQDPTRLEREVRTAAAEREQAHVDRNIARKLTPAERREKKERKLFDDSSNTVETIVSVYRINDLSHKKTRFKVDVNAHENRLTGCAVISDGGGINVVVVEGGSKSIKRYGKLMLKRIDWAAAANEEEDEEDDDREKKQLNRCVLVWQGSVARPSFNRFSVHECMTDAAARKVFADAGVGHYWDLSVNFSEDQI